jgi:UDP-N-acetylmuramoyl-L-alanyl-D-glutamate--2,6-diaminopimelate ligase
MTARLPALFEGFAAALAPDLAVTGIELDSRRVIPGGLFLATQGHLQHGLNFVDEALQRGAAAVAWEPASDIANPDLPVPAFSIEKLGAHAGEIAARFYRHPSRDLFTVGVTGTDGKTSTAHLIAQAFDRLARPSAYFGTIGYGRLGALKAASHTTPDAVRLQQLLAVERDAGAQACAMEVSSHALDQGRVNGVEFDLAILTNIGRDHLDYHGDIETYALAKRKLFAMPGLRMAVLNGDDSQGAEWARALSAQGQVGSSLPRVTLYGLDNIDRVARDECRFVFGLNLEPRNSGLCFDIRSSWGEARLESRLLGRFNVYNLLAALAALLNADVPLHEAVAALAASSTVPGRIEAFRGGADQPLVVVDYAHTPQALIAVLNALRGHTAGKLVCVFGCGGDKDRGKRPLMGAAAAALADIAIVTDDNPRSENPAAIVAEIIAGIPPESRSKIRIEHDRARAIEQAVRSAGIDDVVVIAGKGHEDTQMYGRERRRFSDRAFVAALVGAESPA